MTDTATELATAMADDVAALADAGIDPAHAMILAARARGAADTLNVTADVVIDSMLSAVADGTTAAELLVATDDGGWSL